MGEGVHVQELFGIGKRYDLPTGSAGQQLSVIIHNDGRRELYVLEGSSSEPVAVVELTEERGRLLAAVLSGTYFGA